VFKFKRITWIAIAGTAIFFIAVFIIWQYSVVITPSHIMFFIIMGLAIAFVIWYFQRNKGKMFAEKTRIAIANCSSWWREYFHEDIKLFDGKMQTTMFKDYGEDLFKSFVFQVTSGPRKGHFLRIVYNFVDDDISEINDSPGVEEMLDSLVDTQPARISSIDAVAIERFREEKRQQVSSAIPVLPIRPAQESETSFEEEKKSESEKNKLKRRYY